MSKQLASWRPDLERLIETSAKLEAIVRELITDEEILKNIAIRPHWHPVTADIVFHGLELHEFTEWVRKIALELRHEPDDVKTTHWMGAYKSDQSPDLIATFHLKGDKEFPLMIRALSPRGCKVKPGSSYTPAQGEEPEIHPECAATLKELEDMAFEPEEVSSD